MFYKVRYGQYVWDWIWWNLYDDPVVDIFAIIMICAECLNFEIALKYEDDFSFKTMKIQWLSSFYFSEWKFGIIFL